MYKYRIVIYWSSEDRVYIAEVSELPGCVTHGDTPNAALANANEAIGLWIDTAKEFGNPIPEPKVQRVPANFTEPKPRGARTAANILDKFNHSIIGSKRGSTVRRNNPRIFSNARESRHTANQKAH